MTMLTAENFDTVIKSLESSTDVIPSWSFPMVLVNMKPELMEYTCQLYLGNPGDSGYINTPVDAKLVYVAYCQGVALVFFMHKGHNNMVQFSMVRTGADHVNGKIRTTGGALFTTSLLNNLPKSFGSFAELCDKYEALLS